MLSKKHSIYSLNQVELDELLVGQGFTPESSQLFYRHLYKKRKPKNALSHKLKDFLESHYDLSLSAKIVSTQKSSDGTVKFLIEFLDGMKVETVLIPFFKKYTVCLSSQVGCAMKCSFCFTGTMGLKRHLTADEIVFQYLLARDFLLTNIDNESPEPNIVFMGQGEPLHNFNEVKKAVTIFLEKKGLGLGPRQMTLSTAGYLPGIQKISELPPINIALSLHSPKNEVRKGLIPINQHYPLEAIFQEFDKIKLKKGQFITYEYLLIKDLNDSLSDVEDLYQWLGHRKALINIIPFNPYPNSLYKRPSKEDVDLFKERLVEKKLRTMIRTTKGDDILAACGQLHSLNS
jgi:23S rRNA (adenine2503-C2)-methyltransferase